MLSRLSRFKLPIVVLVIAGVAAAGGLTLAKRMTGGGKEAVAKQPLTPVEFAKPFIINLADTDSMHYIKLSLAVELAPMSADDRKAFEAGVQPEGGGHGESSSGSTGPTLVANDTELRDAVIRTVSQFTSSELLTLRGKEQLERRLLLEFAKLRTDQLNEFSVSGAKGEKPPHNPALPPYDIREVDYSEYSIQ